MKINIITPTYNAAEHITQTANSILEIQQSRSDLDINWIILDNCSVDGIREVLESKRLQGLNYKLIVEPDNGIYDAMNKGLVYCESGHVLFLGAGDKILKLPKQIDSETVYYGTTIVDDDRHFVSSVENYVFNEFNSLHHQSMLVPVSFHKPFNTDYKICADYAHNIEMLIDDRKFSFAADLLAYHMPDGVSSNLQETRVECKLIQQRTVELAESKTFVNRI
jgi:putative colanic acid biosynthesis glycosyltransferase